MLYSNRCVTLALLIFVGLWVADAMEQERKTEQLLMSIVSSYADHINARLDNLANNINTISMLAEEADIEKLQLVLGQMASNEISAQTVEVYDKHGLMLNIEIADRVFNHFEPGQYPIGPLISGSLEPAKKISITLAEYQPFDNRATAQLNIPTYIGDNTFVAQVSFDLSFLSLNQPLSEESPWSLHIVESTGRTLFSLGALEQGGFFDKSKLCHNRFSICAPWQSRLITEESVAPYAPWSVVAIAPAATWPLHLLIFSAFFVVAIIFMDETVNETSASIDGSDQEKQSHAV